MKKVEEKILYKAKWLALKQTTYKSENGETVNWESIERTNTSNTVVIIPKLVPSNRYLMIKQYRPAINNYVLGFPAGLVEGEDLEKEALRELKEETGYVGKVKSISPMLYSNAALLSDTVRVVNVEIDETLEENLNPKQHLESEEEIEVILVNRNNLKSFILEEQQRGTAVGMGPWYAFCEDNK
ncbi:NUDIX hydrolase [Clostridium sp. P21]|uniref:NUDIX hydrolase n=1 Tax=Clostridium muellerianum TaxID=2716538 RepID=A0A7Y0EJP1_9CLOT|nr:NUDIX hydrolase [Clostridium muellerianum]NMM64641.1 NUDIX hydrolase [Clostridium muellerianum]